MNDLVRRNEEDLFDGLVLAPHKFFQDAIREFWGRDFWNPTTWAKKEPSFYPMNVVAVKKDGDIVAKRLEYALAGFTKEDLNVTVKDDTLTITAEHKTEENKEEEAEYNGISYKTLSCKYHLAEDVDQTAITCAFKNGLLTITVPIKKEEPRPEEDAKRIEIQ